MSKEAMKLAGVCCGDYATCIKPCSTRANRGQWIGPAIKPLAGLVAAQQEPVQRYSPDGEGGMEIDSLGAWVKFTFPQPAQQEPVAWICEGSSSDEKHGIDYWPGDVDDLPIGTQLYAAPPAQQPQVRTGNCLRVGVCASEGHKIQAQRTWVGLTDEQIDFLMPYCSNEFDLAEFREFARDIEAKLRSNNT